MIRTYQNTRAGRALQDYVATGSTRGLPVQNTGRITRILAALNVATRPGDMNIPGFRFHPLPPTNRFSVWVSGNYRITFAWDGTDAVDVTIEDYH